MSNDSDTPSDKRRAWRTDQEWSRLRERLASEEIIVEPAGWFTPRVRWLAAAAVILAVGSALTWRLTRREPLLERVATTAAGERIVIRLADSSLVTLGPASRVRYASSGARREVELEGLADFKIVHDARRPFVVRAKNAVATDVGTEFVVRAYPSDSSVQVSVTSGSVDLASSAGRPAIRLQAGDAGRVAENGSASLDGNGSAAARAAWVDGRLVFNDEPLSSVAAELSRWFDVDIRLPNDAVARQRVTAIYNRPSLAGVLEALSASLHLRFEQTGRTVTILPAGR